MKAVILTGGQPPTESLLREHLKGAKMLVGVDGAADVLDRWGISPDLLIGDFDTADPKVVDAFEARGVKVERLKTEKNVTDTQAALDYVLGIGASEIILLGALGVRIDHALSNIAMLMRAHVAGASAKIVDEISELEITHGCHDIIGIKGQTVSILPLSADIRVAASGLKYPLEDLLLTQRESRGVSNVMKGKKATIQVSGGYALVVKTRAGF